MQCAWMCGLAILVSLGVRFDDECRAVSGLSWFLLNSNLNNLYGRLVTAAAGSYSDFGMCLCTYVCDGHERRCRNVRMCVMRWRASSFCGHCEMDTMKLHH